MKLKVWLLLAALAAVELAGMYLLSVQLGLLSVLYLSLVTAFWGFSTLTRHGKSLRQDYEDMNKDPAGFAAQIQVSKGGVEQVKSRYAKHMVGMGSGVLLVVPGPVSDLAGIALKIPALARRVAQKAGDFLEKLPQNPAFVDFASRHAGNFPGQPPNFPGQPTNFPGQPNTMSQPGARWPSQGNRSGPGPVIDTTVSDG